MISIYKRLALLFGVFVIFISPSLAGEKINEIGKIIYSEETSSFYFLYLKENKVVSYALAADNKKNYAKLKKMVNKSVRLTGDLDWKINNREGFSAKEILTFIELSEFELNLLAFDSRKMIEQDNLVSRVNFKTTQTSSGAIEIPDAVADSTIGTASVIVGVLAGPIALIPAAIFGITQLLSDEQ